MAEIASWNGRLLSTAPSMKAAVAGSISACRCGSKFFAMNSSRRGQCAPRLRDQTRPSPRSAPAETRPGKDEVARAAKASARRVVEIEVALDLAVGPAPVGEMQHVAMLQLVDERRIVDLDKLPIAVVIGQRHEQIEAVAGRQQRAAGDFGSPIAVTASYISPAMAAVERRLEPARAHEQRKLLPHLRILDRASNTPVAAAAQISGLRNHLLQLPARASGASSTVTSALSSQRSRSGPIGRSWLSARASMAPLMPPAEAPAMTSTTTRSSSLRPISRSSSK